MDLAFCPICDLPIAINELERHANSHFEDEEIARDMELAQQLALAPPSPIHYDNLVHVDVPRQCVSEDIPQSSRSSGQGCGRNNQAKYIDEKISYIINIQCKATYWNIDGGLMSLLKNCLESENGYSTSILSGHVDHFQSLKSEDMGWGCGWRNIQMACSHLLTQRPEARSVLFGGSGFVPDIPSLQRWLEIAWERGYDHIGCEYYQGKIYGSNKWIGAAECAGLLRSFSLCAKIVDFDGKDSRINQRDVGPMDKFVTRNTGDEKDADQSSRMFRSYQVLVDWVWNYFSDSKPLDSCNRQVMETDKMPLYFQHDGHSRTIVGVQVKHKKYGSRDYNLLILDPGHRTVDLERTLRQKAGWERLIKRGIHTLRKPQYQVCYVDPGLASSLRMEQLKVIEGILVEDCPPLSPVEGGDSMVYMIQMCRRGGLTAQIERNSPPVRGAEMSGR